MTTPGETIGDGVSGGFCLRVSGDVRPQVQRIDASSVVHRAQVQRALVVAQIEGRAERLGTAAWRCLQRGTDAGGLGLERVFREGDESCDPLTAALSQYY